jgi:hypothetical protein
MPLEREEVLSHRAESRVGMWNLDLSTSVRAARNASLERVHGKPHQCFVSAASIFLPNVCESYTRLAAIVFAATFLDTTDVFWPQLRTCRFSTMATPSPGNRTVILFCTPADLRFKKLIHSTRIDRVTL